MSALARHFKHRGMLVSGYDKTQTTLTKTLEKEGMNVLYHDDPGALSGNPELMVYTPAVPVTAKLYQHFIKTGIPVMKRSEVLGMLSRELPTIAVAGTHGKTTVCAMLTHIMKHAGIPLVSLLGGISKNYNTNYIGDDNPQWMIAEADEYDRSFLHLSPRIGLISAIDSDHLDIYGSRDVLIESFRLFADNISEKGVLITKDNIARQINYTGRNHNYRLKPPAGYYLQDIELQHGFYQADICGLLNIRKIKPGHPGKHNLENALAAATLAHQAGVDAGIIHEGINSFTGVKRRFEIVFSTKDKDVVYIDDYAHHPEEIKACIRSARELFPGKKITGIFQPHLFSRTRDFADQFAESLSELDELMLLDIYPAREEPIPGVDTQMLIEKVRITNVDYCSKNKLIDTLKSKKTEILITMGAGDIDRLTDSISQLLSERHL